MDYLKPNSLIDLLQYKLGYKIYSFLQYKDHSNIIFYGYPKSGKSILIKTVMQDIYTGSLIKQKNEDFLFYLHNDYYLFNCSHIHDKIEFTKYIQTIIQTYDYYNDKSKYIILDQFEKMTDIMQNILKVVIEKSYSTCKFIIITNQYNKIIQPIKSRCISIRIPSPSEYDKYLYLKKILKRKKINFTDFHLQKDCKTYDLQKLLFKYLLNDKFNIQDHIYNDVYKIIFQPFLNEKIILKIRGLSSTIKELNIPFNTIMKRFIETLKLKKNSIKMIQTCSEYNYRIEKSYRELIHIEAFIVHLNLLNNDINI